MKKQKQELKRIKLRSIMSSPVVICTSFDTVVYAAKLLEKHKIRTLVIVNDGMLIGTLSHHDITRAVSQEKNMLTVLVDEIMHKGVITGTPEMFDVDAAKIFLKYKIKKLPLLEDGKLVGIVTQTDLLRLATIKWAL